MFRILLLILALVVLYKLIFDLIIPVYRASRDIRKRFRDMNQQMEDRVNQMNQANGFQQQQQTTTRPSSTSSKQDYIDFEEVK